ncbi:MAG: inorganic phosphate transporter [Kineosporiaceae bacterium]
MDVALVAAVVLALVFAWTNGVHDAANAVATTIASRSLGAPMALLLAAVLNGVGVLLGEGVARVTGTTLLVVPTPVVDEAVVPAALLAAIGWNLLTWRWGVPSSSSHALIAGLAGAGLASAAHLHSAVLARSVLWPLLVSPVLGFALAWLFLHGLAAAFRHATFDTALSRFRVAQTVSASAMALGHGLQDGPKTMGALVVALGAAGHTSAETPWWVMAGAALALAAGTWQGGWSLIRTLGGRLVPVDPVVGFAATTAAALTLYGSAYVVNAPLSSTHAITGAVAGAGASARGTGAVRWHLAGRIVGAWLLTPVVCAAAAWVVYRLLTLA